MDAMSQKPHKLHLKVAISGEIYILGSLCINLSKHEIYYLLHHSENAPSKVLDVDNNILIEPMDHISWHRKQVHIRSKNKIVQHIDYPNGDLFPSIPAIRPLLVDSVVLNNSTELLRRDKSFKNFNDADEYLQLQLPHASNFSLILLLVPRSWKTSDIFTHSRLAGNAGPKEIPIWYLRDDTHELGRILAFDNWDLIVWTAPYVRKISIQSAKFDSGYRITDFIKPTDSLYDLAIRGCANPKLSQQQINALRIMMNRDIICKTQDLYLCAKAEKMKESQPTSRPIQKHN